MNMKRTCPWLTALVLLWAALQGLLPGALAEPAEGTVVSADGVRYAENGFLYEPGDRSLTYFYDLTTGSRRPLCARPDCDHRSLETDLFTYGSVPEMMRENASRCFAAKAALACNPYGSVLYGGRLYFFPSFFPGPGPEANTLPLYVTEPEGEPRLLADPGALFPGSSVPQPWQMLAGDGELYMAFFMMDNPDAEGNGPAECTPGSVQLVRCSMDTGEVSLLASFCSESNEFYFLGLYGGVLYYLVRTADGLAPAETEREYLEDRRSKTRYSVLGIDTATGGEVVPDPRLCGRTLDYGESFDIVKDGILYSILLPETAGDSTALFLAYDLERRETVLEYPFIYDMSDNFYPYRVLTEEIMLALNFETGEYALRNLKTGETRPLPIPGVCVYGNGGQADWYDINVAYFQTEPLVLDHCRADGSVDKACISIGELLGDSPRMHDFTEN